MILQLEITSKWSLWLLTKINFCDRIGEIFYQNFYYYMLLILFDAVLHLFLYYILFSYAALMTANWRNAQLQLHRVLSLFLWYLTFDKCFIYLFFWWRYCGAVFRPTKLKPSHLLIHKMGCWHLLQTSFECFSIVTETLHWWWPISPIWASAEAQWSSPKNSLLLV